MSPDKKEHIRQFINNEGMQKAVHSVLLKIFLRSPKNKDVQSLAAAWMAKESFNDAWKELVQIARSEVSDSKVESNIGL